MKSKIDILSPTIETVILFIYLNEILISYLYSYNINDQLFNLSDFQSILTLIPHSSSP